MGRSAHRLGAAAKRAEKDSPNTREDEVPDAPGDNPVDTMDRFRDALSKVLMAPKTPPAKSNGRAATKSKRESTR
jgi:hypothetical protein